LSFYATETVEKFRPDGPPGSYADLTFYLYRPFGIALLEFWSIA